MTTICYTETIMTKPICQKVRVSKTQVCKHVFDRVSCYHFQKGKCNYVHTIILDVINGLVVSFIQIGKQKILI